MNGKTWLRILGVFVVFMTGVGLVFGAAMLLGIGDQISNDPLARLIANLLLTVVVSGLIMVYGQTVGGVPVRAIRFDWDGRATRFALAATVVTLGIGAGYMLLLRQMAVFSFQVVVPSLATLLIGIVNELGVLHEEVHNRGYLFGLLQSHMGIGAMLLFGATYFALGHVPFKGLNFALFSNFLGGLVYGYLYLKSGSLSVSVVAHALHNLTTDLFLTGTNNGVSVGIASFQFADRLAPLQRMGFDLLLTIAILGLIYFFYGRGTRLLEPAPSLRSRWAETVPLVVTTPQAGIAH